jgi:hypothetical protein
MRNKTLLIFSAQLELATGIALIAVPNLVPVRCFLLNLNPPG